MPTRFFDTLNYTSCNEDWRTEWRALKLEPTDRVLAITGGGDRPLHLLLENPAELTAVDINPAQDHLLALKVAAVRELPFDEYAAFLGLTEVTREERLATAERLLPTLSDPARAFWSVRKRLLIDGVVYQGRWERYHQRLALVAQLLRGDVLRRLFELRDLEVQRAFVRAEWDAGWWRRLFEITCRPAFSRLFLGDPAYFARVAPGLTVGRYLYQGMQQSLLRHLARENFMLGLVFLGHLPEGDVPPYLTPEGHATLGARLSRLTHRAGDVVELLARGPPARFTRFSLSEVPSFLDQAGFESLLDAVVHAAAPGARFCIRLFLSAPTVPARLERALLRERALEEALRRDDRAFAYRFLVGTVRK